MGQKKAENLSDISHQLMLDNTEAKLMSKLSVFKEYLNIGYSTQKAMQLTGLKKEEMEKFIELEENYCTTTKTDK